MKMQIKTKLVIATVFVALLAGSVILSGCVEKSTAGSVNIASEPSGAEIWIDNSSTEKVTPATISDLKEGNHTYILRKGYVISNGTFYVKSGQTTNISKVLLTISPTELKYRLLENFKNFTYCDPDIYPVASAKVEYLFSWGDVPGNDSGILIDFLMQSYDIDWVKTAKIEKIDDGKTIRVSTGKNSLSLRLNDEKNGVNLTIDDGRTNEFIAMINGPAVFTMRNGKLNVYFIEEDGGLYLESFPGIRKNTEEFQAILRHNNLTGITDFSLEQKLLIYREHKKLNAISLESSGEAYKFQLGIGTPSEIFDVEGIIDRNGTITILKTGPGRIGCPVCLAGNTRIDTPAGSVAVKDLQKGMAVWTADSSGTRIPATVLKNVSIPVPPDFRIVHLVLDDGRELFASPNHPTADGRKLGDLSPDDVLDGAKIVIAERVFYEGKATYDILPSGDTGFYWANSILIKSTLI
jgi:hypothetical protein